MLAALILLFVLSSGFLLLNSVLVNIALDNKRDEISSILDDRVSVYRLTGFFDDSATKDGIEFKKTVVTEQSNDTKPPETEKSVNRFKPLGIKDIKRMAKKADDDAKKVKTNNIEITYKMVNIAAFDDTLGVADRVKIIQREIKQNDGEEQ
ncbi:pilus assembly protein [Allofrancisella guangzhouensis]|nr:hypothetical protein [Allofrancisella guangzhouensis]MBK2026804.1 pilus assembly protein [Allofrancisella guangzhouensis]MBK2044265.1 pilus assembly protein [Allofrancisella guangzhouensis]MBK2045173.1 pilus assembly protein [Allofrancisella guangzhouensis]